MADLSRDEYHSVNELVNLPPMRHLNLQTERVLHLGNNSTDVKQQIVLKRNALIEELQEHFQVFEDPQYEFVFPESKFPYVPKGERNQISYEHKPIVEEEDTFRDRLSSEQLAQIAEKGEFEVHSSFENVRIPYIWKINDSVFRGRKNIVEFWEWGLSCCYSLIEQGVSNIFEVIPIQVITLAYLPIKFFSLVVGRRRLRSVHCPKYAQEIAIDFWSDILDNELKAESSMIGQPLFDLLHLPFTAEMHKNCSLIPEPDLRQLQFAKQEKLRQQYQSKQNKKNQITEKMRKIENDFEKNWLKIRKRVLNTVSTEENEQSSLNTQGEDDLLNKDSSHREKHMFDQFQQEKFKLYQVHLRTHLSQQNFDATVIESVLQLVSIISIIQAQLNDKTERLAETRQNIVDRVKTKYRVRSRNSKFLNRKVDEEFRPLEKLIEQDFQNNLINDSGLFTHLDSRYQSVYNKYINFIRNYSQLITTKRQQLKTMYVPSRVFRTTYRLLPPYEIIKNDDYYSCVTEKQMSIDTATGFWKFKLYAMRMKSWTINCLVALIGLAWVGPFGLRCLYGFQQFKYDEYCDYKTGFKLYNKRKPVLGVFCKVLEGIRASRQQFEELPDRGLFGKNISRYFNYFQCYVFRLLLVGIIGVLGIYPVLIVGLSLLCFLLIVSFWAWVPVVMVVCYLFNILCFQFESSHIPRGILIRSVPLLSLAIILVKSIVTIVGIAVFGIVIAPLLSTLYFTFLILQRVFRTLTDRLMLFLFRKLGRTPSKDTAVAKKISGPGMSRNYFFSIHEEDVYVLVQCELEAIYLNKFIKITEQRIENSILPFNRIIKFVLMPFGYQHLQSTHSFPHNSHKNIVEDRKEKLIKNFREQTKIHRNRYPRYPTKIRFSEEEIDNYFNNSMKIVRSFVERERVGGWIFDDFHLLLDDYEELTRMVWSKIFGCGQSIFEPLEKLDTRFKVEDFAVNNSRKMKKSVGSVMHALEGEVILSKNRIKFSPAKRSLLSKDTPILTINTILLLHQQNSECSIDPLKDNPSIILFPHQNLSELKAYKSLQEQETRLSHQRIITQ